MRTGRVLAGLLTMVGVCLALLAVKPASAQDDQPKATEHVGLVRTGTETFSLDVEGADIRTVLRAIGEFSGRNIMVANDVHGTVKVNLHNVGWKEALRTILRSAGLDYVDENGILRVDDMGKLQSESVERDAARAKQMDLAPLETRIVHLNYANASELASALAPSLTKRGSIQTEKRTNSMIVSDLSDNVERVEEMALQLDSTTPQIEITAKLVDVSVKALRDLGVEWSVGGLSPGNNPANGTGDVSVSEPKNPASVVLHYGITKNWGNLDAKLEALELNNKANIISNPRITTVDNREARILVGQKIPLIVQDVAGNPVSQLQTIGIQLKVTPHLTSDKKVIMDLHPEVSDLASGSTVQGGVIINTSEADTRVMVDDGQTAVIGGLIRTNDSSTRQGIPFLKDFPIVGILFRSSNVTRENRELIIFVTPRLLNALANN
ncbi:MAG TPA: type IV pilus secretin PilQ [Candidatus Sulfotelmatobacter sp.]|nr:type IV pilus secretin PilQ [Candidatus Sulfotelmatobacter sp.]